VLFIGVHTTTPVLMIAVQPIRRHCQGYGFLLLLLSELERLQRPGLLHMNEVRHIIHTRPTHLRRLWKVS